MKSFRALIVLSTFPLLGGCYFHSKSPGESDAACVGRMLGSTPFSEVAAKCASGPVTASGQRMLDVWQNGYATKVARSQNWPVVVPTHEQISTYLDGRYGVEPGGFRPKSEEEWDNHLMDVEAGRSAF
ncbi:hypothetical protein [Asaia spathodeae]|uniref:Lipoprotein n=1 Tax=Asaia spathodeae TaxID=657016 RepID=A0ABX2P735_9PROT|nr:hypothetical protein [Asaia spathodeae]GBR19919.1 hypothetical protein AA105894_2433 [Asaia spathodeae NBRC 105894]